MIGTYTFMHGDKKIADCKFDKHGYLDSISKIGSPASIKIVTTSVLTNVQFPLLPLPNVTIFIFFPFTYIIAHTNFVLKSIVAKVW